MSILLKLNHHYSRPSTTTQPSYSNTTLPRFRWDRYSSHTRFLSPPNPQLKHNSASIVVVRQALLTPDAALLQDLGAAVFVIGGGYGLVSAFDNLTNRNIISQTLSRKLVHIISGLLFVASWPLFSTSTEARYFASIAPLINSLRLVVHGLSLATDEGLIKSVTREGKPEELLRGPLYYVLTLAMCAIVFWRDSPVGLLSLAMMSGGDGKSSDSFAAYLVNCSSQFLFRLSLDYWLKISLLTLRAAGIADIMGRNFGYVKIPYNQKKSWAGSISMFAFGFLISFGMLYYFSALGYFHLDWTLTMKRIAVVSFVATVVESLPTTEPIDDNISVPLAAMVTAYICFCL